MRFFIEQYRLNTKKGKMSVRNDSTINELEVFDVRMPTSLTLLGSDAMVNLVVQYNRFAENNTGKQVNSIASRFNTVKYKMN